MKKVLALCLTVVISLCVAAGNIDLSGDWKVKLSDGTEAVVRLPGTLDMAGIGEPNTLCPEMKKPQLLRLTRKISYIGPCSYTRTINIPKDMADKPLRLDMERVLWKSTVKVDGTVADRPCMSLTTPHSHVIKPLKAGLHTLEITIDNSSQLDISVDNLCHSYTNDTQTMWNGVLGNFKLSVIPEIAIRSVQVFPFLQRKGIEVKIAINNVTQRVRKCSFKLDVTDKNTGRRVGDATVRYNARVGESTLTLFMHLDAVQLWSDQDPALFILKVEGADNRKEVTFGMREVTTEGKDLLVNGRKIFLRGTLDCCIFPLTGVPPTDHEGWLKEMETLQKWGFNHIRFHSWCPPEAAFDVADSLGIYIQAELPVWSLKIGDDPKVTTFLKDEFKRMSEAYGNHPSWIMSTCGNELQHDFTTLNRLVGDMRDRDPRRLYAATSFTFEKGHGGHAEYNDQFLITQWTDNGWVRGQGVFDERRPAFNENYASAMECVSVPLISHEIGQYAVYPDMKEIEKYTGVLDPLNFKAIRNDLKVKGLLHKSEAYLNVTGRFAGVLYKEEIERALKTPGFSGVQLLGIQDFPGQGTALVGLLNSFWESKGVIDASEFARFNSPVVPLAVFSKAVYTRDETFRAVIDVANYGGSDIEGIPVEWSLADGAGMEKKGQLAPASMMQGEVTGIGEVAVPLEGFDLPSKLTFTVTIPGTGYRNSWNIWVYPAICDVDYGQVRVTASPTQAAELSARGEKVLFMPEPSFVNGVESKFLPVFWSPVHFPKQAGSMGVICDSSHPALAGFPNDGHSDWQWWVPIKNATVMFMDSITDKNSGAHIEPVIGVVDNFVHNRRLGYIFEARLGKGSVVVSSIALGKESPEMKSLLQGLLDYMNSDTFAPEAEIDAATLHSVITYSDNKTKTNSKSIYE